ncbi:unnamed protein product [Dovyalis caffra]|uniref:Uncharacterized protein n=1 Tax=Dovyalis caffra TaxID=77055 RepID=A0AAV1S4Q2_9ROSI|nr:unnamed protein product [Dovyalis caffra]
MKRAKVSAVYEGRIGKRSKEENENDSRIARMHAKARKNGLRAKKTQTFVVTERRRKARSSTKSKVSPNTEACMVKDQEKKLENVEVIEIIDDDPILDIGTLFEPELVNQVLAEPLRAEVIFLEKHEEGPEWWEEYWPVSYRTNEEKAMEMKMNGFVGGMTEEELWWDDIWNFRDMNDHFPKAHGAGERI